jgi:hypothetical protein
MSDAAGDVAAGDPLAVMVLSYLDDLEIELRPDDPIVEHCANTWHYGLPAGFDVGIVVATLGHVVRQLSERHHDRPGTFYCWYDEQAGQLRCSLTSKPPDQLPFGGRYRSTDDVREVLRLAVADPHPGIIPLDELAEIQDPAENFQETPAPFPLGSQPSHEPAQLPHGRRRIIWPKKARSSAFICRR